MFRPKLTDLFTKFPSSVIAAFVMVALGAGVGGVAKTRVHDAWVYPVDALYQDRRHERMTQATVEMIFRDHLRDYKKGREKDLARHFVKTCKKYGFDPAFVLSLISAESSFRARVVSSAGAVGLMQVMPATAAWIAKKKDLPYRGRKSLKDPFTNITLGVAYLAELRDRYRGMSPYYHLAAYNLGPARLDELRARPGFKPTATLVYYKNIMKGVERWRYYSANQAKIAAEREKRREERSGKVSGSVEKSVRLKDRNA